MGLRDRFNMAGRRGIAFRGVPFWSWNDALEPRELCRQVREMARVGLGGHFMHARPGLITEYMGKHWMKCIRKAVEASRKAGIKAWLYDEDFCPSGSAGGLVAARLPNCQAKQLYMNVLEPSAFRPVDNLLCVFSARRNGQAYADIKRIAPEDAPRAPGVVLRFHYADAGYVDLLDKNVVRTFIDVQYEPYRRLLKKEFGKTVPGIFTDEPSYCQFYRRMPWSKVLPESFAKRNGYDLLEVLPSLFLDFGDYRKIRYDFWSTVTDLFVNAFSRQVFEWCDKHGLIFTGHYLLEDSLQSQADVTGAVMPHYEFQHIPGIDHLGRKIGEPLLCKQVSSVAHQLGRRRVISEMYGCSGWNVSFEELKWIAEWQFVQGVDLPCQHLQLYSAKGLRKRDNPPSLFYQQPWWEHYRRLNDYFARLLSMLTCGRHVAHILVLHTIESAWTEYRADGSAEVDALNAELVGLAAELLGMHRDFDFGDETIISRHATVSRDVFRVGKCRYKVVIVPRCITLRSTTVDLLEKFIAGGGTVLRIGPLPERMDGALSSRPAEVLSKARKVSPRRAALSAALNESLPPAVAVTDAKGRELRDIWVQQRHHREGDLFFLANINPHKAFDAEIHIPIRGRLEEFDCDTGEVRPLRCKAASDGVRFPLHFFSKGSHLLLVRPGARPLGGSAPKPKLVRTRKLADDWKTHRKSPNALTLDYCRYRTDGGEWSDRMPVIAVQAELDKATREVTVELEYTFESQLDPQQQREVFLVMEEPAEYEITINGTPAPRPSPEWWRDVSLRKMLIDSLLVDGTNTIVMKRNFLPASVRRKRSQTAAGDELRWLRQGVELESIYIVGDFAVRCLSDVTDAPRRTVDAAGPFVLVEETAVTTTGDLASQGMPFFAGTVGLSQTFRLSEDFAGKGRKVFLEMDRPDAIVTSVAINGHPAGKLVWQPFRLDVTRLLKPGLNHIEIELTGSCRNLLGPHHCATAEPDMVTPDCFITGRSPSDKPAAGHPWRDRYSLVRFGLASAPKLRVYQWQV